MIELVGERLKRYELNRTVKIAPRHGNRLHAVRVEQNEATEPITVPTREENGAFIADIPNIFMERYGTITVEVISVDKHGSKNYEKRSFVVHDNKKPDGYKYEENVSSSSSGSGSGAQPDWNATEGEPGHVLNRTHWKEPGVILEETTLTEADADGAMVLPQGFSIEAGETYEITYNGTAYTCVAVDSEEQMGQAGMILCGNWQGVFGIGDSGEPFVMMTMTADNTAAVMDLAGATSCTVKIIGSVAHKLDKKFLPDEVVNALKVVIVTAVNDVNGNPTASLTPAEIRNELYKGRAVMFVNPQHGCTIPLVECNGNSAHFYSYYRVGTNIYWQKHEVHIEEDGTISIMEFGSSPE